MPNILVNGVRTYYEEHGQGDPIIFIHGLGACYQDWEYVVPEMAKHFRVISYDVRGHGLTEKPKGPYSMSLFANDLKKIMDKLKLEKAHIAGVSMGGMIAFQFAVDYPKLVDKLIIINSVPDVKLKALQEKYLFYSRVLLAKVFGFERMNEVLNYRLFPRMDQKHLRKKMSDRFKKNDEKAYLSSLYAIAGWGIGEKIKNIKAPTLVVSAETDYLPLSVKEDYVSKMSNAQLDVIMNSRHATQMDQPKALVDSILHFLEIKNVSK